MQKFEVLVGKEIRGKYSLRGYDKRGYDKKYIPVALDDRVTYLTKAEAKILSIKLQLALLTPKQREGL